MFNKSFILLAISSVSMLAADQYYRPYNPSCPGGNCPYQGQSQGYYQDSRPYYDGQSNRSYYESSSRPSYDNRSYYEGSSRSSSYDNSNHPYNDDSRFYQGDSRSYQDQGVHRRDSSDRSYYQEHYNDRNQRDSNRNQDRDGYYNSSNNDSKTSTSDRNTAKTDKYISDEDIAKEVHDVLGSNWLSSGYPDVTFDVRNGVVNLRGTVHTQDEKTKLENSIRKIDGVKQVKSDVSVAQEKKTAYNASKGAMLANVEHKMKKASEDYPRDSAASESDQVINAKIRDRLSGWFSKGYETIILTTENGVVTVTGFVEDPDEVNKINKEAKNVEGVKTVNNKVSVQPKR